MLTKKQKNLLIFINKKIRSSGISPSYEEMKNSLNLKSKSGIHRLISALEERGFVKRLAHKARALEVVKLPENASANDIFNTFTPSVIKGGLDKEKTKSTDVSVLGSIAARTPIEAIQQEVDRVALPEDLQNKGEHYGLKVLKISLALAFSGNFTTSKALALCANLLTNPRSSKAEINLWIPDFDLRLSEFFISS